MIMRGTFLLALSWAVLAPLTLFAEDDKPHELTSAAKETIRIIKAERFDFVAVNPSTLDSTFDRIKERLAQKGITVRLLKSGRREVPSGKFELTNVSLSEFMALFDEWAGWGWIVYDDGSITYFDVVCACCWPKNGIGYHKSQYQAGSPENMKRTKTETK